MTTARPTTVLALLSLAVTGCGTDPLRTGIKIQLQGDAEAIRAEVDRILLVVDPESPYTSGGVEVEEGAYSSTMAFENWNADDASMELVVTLEDLGSGGSFPLIELAPGINSSAFTVSAHGMAGAVEMARSEVEGPLSFKKNSVVTYDVGVALLDEPVSQCNDGTDNDEDGYTDTDDPDCDDGGTEEAGFGSAQCNDGTDNDGDGTIDAEDSDCTDANDNDESYACDDGIDNDADGWTDADDPDCTTGDEEIGLGDTACNDGTDNDDDSLWDADDPDCEDALDDDEKSPPCEDGIDNEGDGWTDERRVGGLEAVALERPQIQLVVELILSIELGHEVLDRRRRLCGPVRRMM